jgi:hypothetical protein
VHVAQSTRLVATVIGRFGLTLIGREVTWSSSNAAVATVDGSGSVTGRAAGSAVIRATSEGKVGQATVTVTAAPVAEAVVASVTVNPASASIRVGETPSFSATVRDASGSVLTGRSISWSSTNTAVATISSTGVVTGIAVGTTSIRATSDGITGSATLTVSAATLQSLVLTPASVTLASGATRQFSVSGVWSDGATAAPAVTYSATGGMISATGLYSAGQTAGTYRVIAVQQGGTRADTSTVVVTVTAPVLQAVVLSPSSVSLTAGATRQFSVSGQWSDAGTTVPSVTYSATGGTISAGGLYTAGGTAGTYRVIAVQQGGTLADTSTVVVSAVNPSGAAPLVEEDFSQYTSTANMLSDPRGIYRTAEDFRTASIALDQSVGYGTSSRSMRYDYPAGTGRDFTISRMLNMPSGARGEVWVEFAVRWSSNFTITGNGQGAGPALKLLHVEQNGVAGRFGINLEGSSIRAEGPNDAYQSLYLFGNVSTAALFNSQWHVIRYHVRLGESDFHEFWVDGVYQGSKTGATAASSLWGVALARNLNMLADRPMSMWWGRVRLWGSNPGW